MKIRALFKKLNKNSRPRSFSRRRAHLRSQNRSRRVEKSDRREVARWMPVYRPVLAPAFVAQLFSTLEQTDCALISAVAVSTSPRLLSVSLKTYATTAREASSGLLSRQLKPLGVISSLKARLLVSPITGSNEHLYRAHSTPESQPVADRALCSHWPPGLTNIQLSGARGRHIEVTGFEQQTESQVTAIHFAKSKGESRRKLNF